MNYYEDNPEEMIVRDYLALDRTKLANERTLLSYIRAFIYFMVSGVGFIELTEKAVYMYIGIILAAISPVFLVLGIYRFIRLKKILGKLLKKDS